MKGRGAGGETFAPSPRLRWLASLLPTAGNWVANWEVVRTFPPPADLGPGLACGVSTVLAVLVPLFVGWVWPESGNRELS
ncbi:hypothetical protein [Deinococcus aestuarii]|uniref:hypothetical protein n=1 Tax=Deinococcus aestuarii TaxID=2774531 RepID=UPI001C0C7866|nr:hypothetical protein [Deinococcus aestuarii]